MSTPILAGRDVAATDRVGAPKVALVNEAFAKKFFKRPGPARQDVHDRHADRARRRVQIVGLVGRREVRQPARAAAADDVCRLGAGGDSRRRSRASACASTARPTRFRATVLQAIQSVHKEAVVDFKAFEEDVRAAVIQERLIASLSAFFGGLALLLAAIGLYGVMSYSVARRRNEIGIRMALGAEPGSVMRLVLRNVALVTVVGLVDRRRGLDRARAASSTRCSSAWSRATRRWW